MTGLLARLAPRLAVAAALLLAQQGGARAACDVPPVATPHSPGYAPSRPQTVLLDPATYPDARCNDGTQGAYAIRRGFGAASHRWVIWLHGGGLCWDQASCTRRAGTQQTSARAIAEGRPVGPRMVGPRVVGPRMVGLGGGLLSQDPAQNPDFHDANLVALAYCSSDFWSGGTNGDPAYPPDDVRSWHFQGRAIVTAVVRDLIARHGLGPGQEVLFGGGSAGGVGAFLTLNDVAPLLAGTRLLAAADGGFAIDAPGPNGAPGGATPMEALIAQAMALWHGRGDRPCAARATTAHERMECYSPDFLTHGGRLATPVFIRQSEQDRVQLSYNGVRAFARGAGDYLRQFGGQMARALATVDPWHSVFATADTGHLMMENPDFTGGRATFPSASGVFETSIAKAFGDWYRRPCPATRDIQPPA